MNAEMTGVKAPWLNFYGEVPAHLDYFDGTLYEAVETCANQYPDLTAYVFMGKKTTYRAMLQEINLCARALKAMGVRPGDKITMAMPNCPQAVTMFYAINMVGATANMIHALYSAEEIE
ncbi:MAG: AMP-binding protein, partial [Oscillibacter sp.]|nr:AMP-binding protein [Oscillibacter sp.]